MVQKVRSINHESRSPMLTTRWRAMAFGVATLMSAHTMAGEAAVTGNSDGIHRSASATILQKPLEFESTADGLGMTARAGNHKLRIDAGGAMAFGDTGAATVRLRLEGADASAAPIGEETLPGHSNYFLGNDADKWRRAVPQFRKTRVKHIYPGIDLLYYGNGKQLEHDYIIAAGSDPSKIQMRIEGAATRIERKTGDLVIATHGEEFLRLERPVAYQTRHDGSRAPIEARYRKRKDGSLSVAVGRYDRHLALIVDPVLRYVSYLGGNQPDAIMDVQFDGTGNLYVLMRTESTDLPATVEAAGACSAACGSGNTYVPADGSGVLYDFYVAKFDPTGKTLVFATSIGGSSNDVPQSLKLDADGTLYLFGQSRSQDYPLANAFNTSPPSTALDQNDLNYYENVLTKLSADGSTILYSTYFGDGAQLLTDADLNHKLALAGNGIAYITGEVNFEGTSNGGSLGSFARGVSIFRAPVFAHGQEYIAKFDTTLTGNASLIYCTPIGVDGAPNVGYVTALGVDSQKNLWIYGATGSASFPMLTSNALQAPLPGSQGTTFLMELNPTGTQELYGTYFGGSMVEIPYDMALDANDNIYVVLLTQSADYPLKNAAYSGINGNTFAMTRFSTTAGVGSPPGLSVVYSTFLSDRTQNSIAATAAGMAAVAGGGTGVPLKNNLLFGSSSTNNGGMTFQVFDTNKAGDASVLVSSYLGTPFGEVYRVAFDPHNDLWLAGDTGANLPVVAPYQAACGTDCNDGFMARVQLLTLAPSSVSFPSTGVGASSAPVSATLSSQSLKNYTLSTGTLSNSSDFSASSTCTNVLSATGNCTVTFTFTPRSAGALTSTYTIEDTDDPAEALTVVLNGTATGAAVGTANPMLSPATLDFGTLTVGTAGSAQNATLSNSGTAALTITSVILTGSNSSSFSIVNGCASSLSAGANCTIAVACLPTVSGALTATLAVNYPSPQPQQVVALSCTGAAAAAPQAMLAAATADFGTVTVGAASTPQTFTLTNGGNAALPVTSASLAGGGAGDFTIGTNTCASSLAAGASCTIAVTFTPGAPGVASATLAVVDSIGTQTSTLTGTGSPAPSDFGVSATPGTETIGAGDSTTFAVEVTSAQGIFTQPVTLTASGLPVGVTATFSPATVTPGAGGAPTTLTIDTSALTAASQQSLNGVLGAPLLCAMLILPVGLRRRQTRGLAVAVATVAIALILQGCNGGFALPQSSSTSLHAQTYTVTITGTAGSIIHSTTVQVTIDSNLPGTAPQ